MYKYDLHVHTDAGSLCGVSAPEKIVSAYHRAGYSGIVITDHFIKGNTCVPQNIPFEQRIDIYYSAVLRARRAAEKYHGFTVFFGAEFAYAAGAEILIYGAEPDFLKAHPEIEKLEIEEICGLLRRNGCLTVKAHPYRIRPYNDPSVSHELYCVDGCEVYNSHNTAEENAKALAFARGNGLIMTSGGDIHDCSDKNLGKAGIEADTAPKTNSELIRLLKSEAYRLIADF